DPDVALSLERLDEAGVVLIEVRVRDAGGDVPERDDRELWRVAEVLELGPPADLCVEKSRLAQVPLDGRADPGGAVRTEGEPELQGAEGPRVLERDVDHVVPGPFVRDVVLVVRERAVE